jgi:ketosteroid isomerase-like protein
MTDEEAIRSAIAEYAHLIDDGRLDEWVTLYLEEGELDIGGHVLRGRAEIVSFLSGSSSQGSSTHIFSVPDIRVDGDKAVAVADFLLAQNDGQRISVGRVNDEWVREPDRWRIRTRRIALKS